MAVAPRVLVAGCKDPWHLVIVKEVCWRLLGCYECKLPYHLVGAYEGVLIIACKLYKLVATVELRRPTQPKNFVG